jgi:hypothetical protein
MARWHHVVPFVSKDVCENLAKITIVVDDEDGIGRWWRRHRVHSAVAGSSGGVPPD